MSNLKHAIRDELLKAADATDDRVVVLAARAQSKTLSEIVARRIAWRTALLSRVKDRIYYQGLPPDADFPRLQILQLGTDANLSLDGPITLTKGVLMIEAQSQGNQDEADEVADLVRKLLNGFSGTAGIDETVEVDNIEMIDDQDDKHPPLANEDAVYRDFQDFEIWYHNE